jgi:hypothetical protein
MEHHPWLGHKPRFGERVAVEDARDKPIEAIVADNRLPPIIGGINPDKSFDHLSQGLASATATDDGAQVLKHLLVDGLQAPLKPLGCPPERAQFARLRRVAKQPIDAVDDLERDGVYNLGAALKVVRLIERSLVKSVELGLERFDSHPLFSNACSVPGVSGHSAAILQQEPRTDRRIASQCHRAPSG